MWRGVGRGDQNAEIYPPSHTNYYTICPTLIRKLALMSPERHGLCVTTIERHAIDGGIRRTAWCAEPLRGSGGVAAGNWVRLKPRDLGMNRTLEQAVEGLPRAHPDLLQRRALLKRTDTKRAVPVSELPDLITALGNKGYARLPGVALQRYDTQYFDTDDLECFRDHLRGRTPRVKARLRHYPDRSLSYLEVKKKNAAGTTDKKRLEVDAASADRLLDNEEVRDFLETCAPHVSDRLGPQVRTVFHRLTLLGIKSEERITLDIGITFEGQGKVVPLSNMAVLEIKQRRLNLRSQAFLELRKRHIREKPISKYCAGTVLLVDDVRAAPFRNRINRMMRLVAA